MLDIGLDPITLLRRPIAKVERGARRAAVATAPVSRVAKVVGSANLVFGALLDDITRLHGLVRDEMAVEVESILRSRVSLWPSDTGRSRAEMHATSEDGDIVVSNTAPYALPVTRRKNYAHAGPNPNYEAGKRTVLKFWPVIKSKALRRALKGFEFDAGATARSQFGGGS